MCEDSHWWYDGLRRIWSQSLRGHVPECSGFRIADIGCGTGGNIASAVRELSAKMVGVDASPLAISLASRRPECGMIAQARAESLPFRSQLFDAVLSTDVLYIRGIDEKKALREMYRILRPGGLLLINLPAFECLRGRHDQKVHTQKRYEKTALTALLHDSGFNIVKMSYWNFFLFPLVYLQRKCSVIFSKNKTAAASDVKLPGHLMNRFLKNLLTMERFFFLKTGLPWGSSIFAIAQKPA